MQGYRQFDAGYDQVEGRAAQDSLMDEDGGGSGQQRGHHESVGRVIREAPESHPLGGGKQASAPGTAQGIPGRIVQPGQTLDESSQRRTRVAEKNPEMSQPQSAPGTRHGVIKGAQPRQSG